MRPLAIQFEQMCEIVHRQPLAAAAATFALNLFAGMSFIAFVILSMRCCFTALLRPGPRYSSTGGTYDAPFNQSPLVSHTYRTPLPPGFLRSHFMPSIEPQWLSSGTIALTAI